MPTSVKFYREVPGFELAGNSPIVHSREGDYFHWAMLRRGSNTLMLNTAYDERERPHLPDPARFAAHNDIALFFGCPDVHAAFDELLPCGVTGAREAHDHRLPNAALYHRRLRRIQPLLPRPNTRPLTERHGPLRISWQDFGVGRRRTPLLGDLPTFPEISPIPQQKNHL